MELEKAAPKKAAFSYAQDVRYSAVAWMQRSAFAQDVRTKFYACKLIALIWVVKIHAVTSSNV